MNWITFVAALSAEDRQALESALRGREEIGLTSEEMRLVITGKMLMRSGA